MEGWKFPGRKGLITGEVRGAQAGPQGALEMFTFRACEHELRRPDGPRRP